MKVLISETENLKNKSQTFNFCEIIEELNPELPLTAELKVYVVDENYVNVSGKIKAKINLSCDYCLEKIEKELNIDIDETFARQALHSEYKDETELKEGLFIEDLNGSDEIDITDLIYQSVILNIPNKLVCDINCIGEENIGKYTKKEISDPRLNVFKTIKIEKDN